jgi:hypothetical protein
MNYLIERVLEQILIDVKSNDLTALEELLTLVPTEALENYLPKD